ncbi:neuroparsin-A-like [Cimex lectularius]|uniref:Uncharacterized protein n=1 Tax=Cimex lectularius TaxID=79782 RepID=A0A8I6RQ25_CIMLE|nr:neuroparsin-A-like [Cimex lectularius]XP_014249474.1 neuroparsin-A-like [Cimex lectularius]XP_014249475.1 neuroparsin-A-like [Cimex lectularius]
MFLCNYFTLVVAITFLQAYRINSKPFCPPCHEDNSCKPEIEKCQYEIVTDYCGRKVCSKGPGQRCGGLSNFLGTCAKGLQCKCNKCSGCALQSLKCFYNEIMCFD